MSEQQRAVEISELRQRFGQALTDAMTCVGNAEHAFVQLLELIEDGPVYVEGGNDRDDLLVHLAVAARSLRAARALDAQLRAEPVSAEYVRKIRAAAVVLRADQHVPHGPGLAMWMDMVADRVPMGDYKDADADALALAKAVLGETPWSAVSSR